MAKVIIYAFLLVAIIAGGYAIHYTTEVDEANKDLIAAQNQVSSLQNHVKSQTAFLEIRREIKALLSASVIMQQEAATIRQEVRKLREDEFAARRDFEQAIQKSRNDAAGLVINDAVLPSGLRLFNARVQKVEGDVTTVSHSDGISQLTPDMLPAELKERFRFGMSLEAPPPSSVKPATLEAAAPAAGGDRSQELQAMQSGLPRLEEELKKAEAEAQSATTPTKRFTAKNRVDALKQQIEELKSKVATAEADLRKAN